MNFYSESPCHNCKGAFICWKEDSPCHTFGCGSVEGTGPQVDSEEDQEESVT